MLTPSIVPPIRPFYAVGNTPAVSLTRCLPQGLDADILLLGCGDVRHVLYTAHYERGFPRRKLDVTCCDFEDGVIARNALLYAFLLEEDEPVSSDILWRIYYDRQLDEPAMLLVQKQVVKLLPLTDTAEHWHSSKYGAALRFCDSETLAAVRTIWIKFDKAVSARASPSYERDFSVAMDQARAFKKRAWSDMGFVYAHCKAASPFSQQLLNELLGLADRYWKTGLTDETPPSVKLFPNPLFASCLSNSVLLAWPSEPLGTYYLAPAYAELTELSPLRLDSRSSGVSLSHKIVDTARLQFREWTGAFRERSSDIVVRFTTADCFAFCHTLQHNLESGETCANWYRRQVCFQPLRLAESQYGKGGRAPKQFDVIDTSNLSDYHGAVNTLVAAGPLLKDAPSSTLYTELMSRGKVSENKKFETLLCGHTRTVSMLLGLAPVEYWTNARAVSFVDECIISLISDIGGNESERRGPKIQSLLEWKRDEYLSSSFWSSSSSSSSPTRTVPAPWSIKPADLGAIAYQIYLNMFNHESKTTIQAFHTMTRAEVVKQLSEGSYVKYHRGNFVAFLKAVCKKRGVDYKEVARETYKLVDGDENLILGGNYLQGLLLRLSMSGLFTPPALAMGVGRDPSKPGFSRWRTIPAAVAITLVVPSAKWRRVYQVARDGDVGLPVETHLRSSMTDNMFSEVQVGYGTVITRGSRDDDDFVVLVEAGGLESDLLVSFYASTAGIQGIPGTSVAFTLQATAQNMKIFGRGGLGLEVPLIVYETLLTDESHVFISKYLPHQTGYGVVGGSLTPNIRDLTLDEPPAPQSRFVAGVDSSSGDITTITGHIDMASTQGKQLLADKAAIELRQSSPYIIDIVFGTGALTVPLAFPVPVVKDRCRTRIARKSSYVEVIATPADPTAFDAALDGFVFPTTLARGPSSSPSFLSSSSSTGFFPATLNLPHVNLDSLPILSVANKEHLRPLITFASHIFSTRERAARDAAQESNLGLSATSGRLNLKESLFTMLMLVTGLQGGQTGLFSVSHPQRGGVHMLLLVSALRLDSGGASVVLDAAALPLTPAMLRDPQFEAFLLMLRGLECCALTVDDAELALWKRTLPAMAERCRTWEHRADCEYRASSSAAPSIPLSLEPGGPVLCSCGQGQLPRDFVSVPDWEVAARYATRVAISPVFASPMVESVFDPDAMMVTTEKESSAADKKEAGADSSGDGARGGIVARAQPKCLACGAAEARNGGALRKCSRCLAARYCSQECQKKDWRKHRMECREADEHQQ